jgi:hypothetical protein
MAAAPPAISGVSPPPPVILPPPPVLAPPDGTAVTVTGGVAVTVTCGAVTVAVTVPVGDTPDVPDVVTDGENTVGVVDDDAVGDGVGLSAPDSAVACAAVPVSAIAAAPTARQPDARLMRIAISRSCSPDRFVTVMPDNASDRGS